MNFATVLLVVASAWTLVMGALATACGVLGERERLRRTEVVARRRDVGRDRSGFPLPA